jgi:FAD/FMN-containing dehydrogenase
MSAPPLPFIPADRHGTLVTMVLACCTAPVDAAERALAPIRALAPPLVDLVKPIRYPEMFPPEDESYHPAAVAKTMFVERVDHAAAETMIEFLSASDAPMRVAQLRVLGGAVSRVPVEATAYAHRREKILVNLAAFYTGPDDRPFRQAWVDAFAGALHQGSDAAYVAFLGDEGEARVRAAYPEATRRRLAAVKAQYDPANVFRLNQNITPS